MTLHQYLTRKSSPGNMNIKVLNSRASADINIYPRSLSYHPTELKYARSRTVYGVGDYIVRRFTTGSPRDEPHWLPNTEMTKLCEVSDETSTDAGFPALSVSDTPE